VPLQLERGGALLERRSPFGLYQVPLHTGVAIGIVMERYSECMNRVRAESFDAMNAIHVISARLGR